MTGSDTKPVIYDSSLNPCFSEGGCNVPYSSSNGEAAGEGGVPLHNAKYDFNDNVLATGAHYFAEVARTALAWQTHKTS